MKRLCSIVKQELGLISALVLSAMSHSALIWTATSSYNIKEDPEITVEQVFETEKVDKTTDETLDSKIRSAELEISYHNLAHHDPHSIVEEDVVVKYLLALEEEKLKEFIDKTLLSLKQTGNIGMPFREWEVTKEVLTHNISEYKDELQRIVVKQYRTDAKDNNCVKYIGCLNLPIRPVEDRKMRVLDLRTELTRLEKRRAELDEKISQFVDPSLSNEEYDSGVLEVSNLEVWEALRDYCEKNARVIDGQEKEKGQNCLNCEGYGKTQIAKVEGKLRRPEALKYIITITDEKKDPETGEVIDKGGVHFIVQYHREDGTYVNYEISRTNWRKDYIIEGEIRPVVGIVVAWLAKQDYAKERIPDDFKKYFPDNSEYQNRFAGQVEIHRTNTDTTYQVPTIRENARPRKAEEKSEFIVFEPIIVGCDSMASEIGNMVLGEDYDKFEKLVKAAEKDGCIDKLYTIFAEGIIKVSNTEMPLTADGMIAPNSVCGGLPTTTQYLEFLKGIEQRGIGDSIKIHDLIIRNTLPNLPTYKADAHYR